MLREIYIVWRGIGLDIDGEVTSMENYDVAVVGGGVAGSVAALVAAKRGLRTLLVEKHKTPRNKPCSGIQFTYFEKLVGRRIPSENLCENELNRVEIITPSGEVVRGRMPMLNFWRSSLDSWLNSLAADAGAEFHDQTALKNYRKDKDAYAIELSTGDRPVEARTRYLVGADGAYSRVRTVLRPQDIERKVSGAAINYYFVGETDLDPNTLYMFYDREFAPLMFAWAYLKDDKWVVGTGANERPLEYADRFFQHVRKRYHLRGKIVKREGFTSTLRGGVCLGDGNVLLTGDAAGLVDLYRGLGMDNAALSGRLAVRAVEKAERTGRPAIEPYRRLMKKPVDRLEVNARRQAERYTSNQLLEQTLSPASLLKGGLAMMVASKVNRLLPPENLILLPT